VLPLMRLCVRDTGECVVVVSWCRGVGGGAVKLWPALTGRWQLWRSGLFLFGGGGCNDKLRWAGPGQIDLGSLTTEWVDRTGV
jgi:hypothetical protein